MENKTYTVISYYWSTVYNKEEIWQTHNGCSEDYVERTVYHQTSRGFKVKVFEEKLVFVSEYEANKEEVETCNYDDPDFDDGEWSKFEYNFEDDGYALASAGFGTDEDYGRGGSL